MPKGSPLDLAGQRFGSWKVLGRAKRVGANRGEWRCRCVCGVEKIVTTSNLRSGLTTQCRACSNRNREWTGRQVPADHTGKRFGSWVVLRLADRTGAAVVSWVCRCDCGKEAAVSATNLVSGNSTRCRSCGTRHAHKSRRIDAGADMLGEGYERKEGS